MTPQCAKYTGSQNFKWKTVKDLFTLSSPLGMRASPMKTMGPDLKQIK